MYMDPDRLDDSSPRVGRGGATGTEDPPAQPSRSSIPLPEGRTLDLRRDRWQGVLSPDEVSACRDHGIPLGYDCAQCGWVPLCVGKEEGADGVFADPSANTTTLEAPAAPVAPWGSAFQDGLETLLHEFREGSFGVEVAREKVRRDVHAIVTEVYADRGLREADRAHWAFRTLAANRCPVLRVPEPGFTPDAEIGFRGWCESDLDDFRSLLGNPRVWEFLPEPFPEPFDEETARTLIELGSLDFHHRALAVELSGVPIGQCLLRFDDSGSARAAEVAYWLGEEYWGQGLMSRILPAFTRQSFLDHDIDVIYAWIRADHGASERVARRAGYRRDFFPFEAELAESMGRPGFVRYAIFRGP